MSNDISTLLLAVPNVSEGADAGALSAVGNAFGSGVLTAPHADPDHGRAVFTLAGNPGQLAQQLLAGAREAVTRIDITAHHGAHPHVGAVDVVPIVHLDDARRGAACAEALVTADLLAAELGLPVFLYGALAQGRTRSDLRRGGIGELTRRMAAGELRPDFGPPTPHPTAGAVLVAARPPLVAFNVELAPPATRADARRIAAQVREGGEHGIPGLRAIGLQLPSRGNIAQVSMNVERPFETPLAAVVAAIGRLKAVAGTELVGLAPAAAFDGFPDDLVCRNRVTIEDALARRA